MKKVIIQENKIMNFLKKSEQNSFIVDKPGKIEELLETEIYEKTTIQIGNTINTTEKSKKDITISNGKKKQKQKHYLRIIILLSRKMTIWEQQILLL